MTQHASDPSTPGANEVLDPHLAMGLVANDAVEGGYSLAPAANPDLRWYVVHAYSGM